MHVVVRSLAAPLVGCSLGAVLSLAPALAQAEAAEAADSADSGGVLPTQTPACGPAEPAALEPPGAHVLAGGREHYRPLLRLPMGDKCMMLELPLSAAVRAEGVSSFPVDRDGGEHEPGFTLSPRLRLGLTFDTGLEIAPVAFHAEYEHDVVTGTAGPDAPLAGDGYANPAGFDHQLRKGFVRFSIARYLHLSAGWMTSHWGMGLVANDGAHGWSPGSAQFTDPRGGDRVLRAQLATGPHGDIGFVAAVGADLVDEALLTGDDALLAGDEAKQLVGAIMVGQGKAHGAGFYAVMRRQESADGSRTDVRAFDLTARTTLALDSAVLTFETEGVVITGTTELAPTTVYEEHDVLQAGAAFRAGLDAGEFGAVLDFLMASGDQNLDDPSQNAFKADPNFEMGLLLYRHVLAAHTARGVATASDLTLVGVPADDLERIATRGSATNTLAVFPKLRYRPVAGLEGYTGVLFAWAMVPVVDPFNTRIGGGTPRNALNGVAGNYLGTELDVGVRYRLNVAGVEATLGGEFAALRPGGALLRADGTSPGAVYLGRLMLDARL